MTASGVCFLCANPRMLLGRCLSSVQNPLWQHYTWWFIPLSKWVITLVLSGHCPHLSHENNQGELTHKNDPWDEPPSTAWQRQGLPVHGFWYSRNMWRVVWSLKQAPTGVDQPRLVCASPWCMVNKPLFAIHKPRGCLKYPWYKATCLGYFNIHRHGNPRATTVATLAIKIRPLAEDFPSYLVVHPT